MKHNEFLRAALLYGIITIFGSVMSVFNIPAICTTHHLIGQSNEKNTQLYNITKAIYFISIILTLIITLFYFWFLKAAS